MANVKHIVIIRTDLQFHVGLIAAQVAHISDGFIRERIENDERFSPIETEWVKQPYIAVLAISCLEELIIIRDKAKEQGLQVHEWHDIVVSPTLGRKIRAFVGISIGPADSDKIALVTSELPLLE